MQSALIKDNVHLCVQWDGGTAQLSGDTRAKFIASTIVAILPLEKLPPATNAGHANYARGAIRRSEKDTRDFSAFNPLPTPTLAINAATLFRNAHVSEQRRVSGASGSLDVGAAQRKAKEAWANLSPGGMARAEEAHRKHVQGKATERKRYEDAGKWWAARQAAVKPLRRAMRDPMRPSWPQVNDVPALVALHAPIKATMPETMANIHAEVAALTPRRRAVLEEEVREERMRLSRLQREATPLNEYNRAKLRKLPLDVEQAVTLTPERTYAMQKELLGRSPSSVEPTPPATRHLDPKGAQKRFLGVDTPPRPPAAGNAASGSGSAQPVGGQSGV